jgi:hypothetical protein
MPVGYSIDTEISACRLNGRGQSGRPYIFEGKRKERRIFSSLFSGLFDCQFI